MFSKIFKSNQSLKPCPRCLGKGHVNIEDIKRLHQELKWQPGPCAYCDSKGKVQTNLEEKVPVDTTYLVSDLSSDERKKIINRNPEALKRGEHFNEKLENFIKQINYLHFRFGLTPTQISDFFLIGLEGNEYYEKEKKDINEYVIKVIQESLKNN